MEKGFPKAHWVKIYSTNTLERLKKEVKRRADAVGIFPNEESIMRLLSAVLMQHSREEIEQTEVIEALPLCA
ncbi:transposase, Mutator family protein (plasmid) [Klebsiella oxytoca]|nr:transposase, Mutator family protein [Klebsiella oxytoca]